MSYHFSRCDPQKAIRGKIFHRLLLLYRTRSIEIRIWAMAATQVCETPFGNQFQLFFCASCHASRKQHRQQQTSPSRMRGASRPENQTQKSEYMSKAFRRLQSWTRRLARAALRIKQRLRVCELPDSPDSSEYAPFSNESDEDDFDCGTFIDGETAHANQRNQFHQTNSSAKKNRSTSPQGKVKEQSPNKRR